MTSFQWSITTSRRALLDKLEQIPEFGKKSKSEILELALEDFILKHGISNNPQTKLELYEKDILAIPNIYAQAKDFRKFYKLIKTKAEYERLQKALFMITEIHKEYQK